MLLGPPFRLLAFCFLLARAAAGAENIYPRLDLFRYATIELNSAPTISAIRNGPGDSIYLVAQALAGFRFDGRVVGGPAPNGSRVGLTKSVVAAYRSSGELIYAELRGHDSENTALEDFFPSDAEVDSNGNLFVVGTATAWDPYGRAFLVNPAGGLVWTKAFPGSFYGNVVLDPPSSFLSYGSATYSRYHSAIELSRWSPAGAKTVLGEFPLRDGYFRSPTSFDTVGEFSGTLSGRFAETFVSRGQRDILVARYDNSQLRWVRQLGGASNDSLQAVSSSSDCSYIIYNDSATGKIAKFSPEGDLIFDKPAAFWSIRTSIVTPDGGLVVGGGPMLLQKYDRDGRLEWDYKTDCDQYDQITQMDVDSRGRLLVLGEMKGPGRLGSQNLEAEERRLMYIARFTLDNPPDAPTVALKADRQSLQEGDTLRIHAIATGVGPFQFQWQRDGIDLASQTTDTLVVSSITQGMGGSYSVDVRSPSGTTKASLQIDVLPLLRITRAPISKTVPEGTVVELAAELSAPDGATIQWLLNDEPIKGAQSQSFSAVASLATVGRYTFTASFSGRTVRASALLDLPQPYLPPRLLDAWPIRYTGSLRDALIARDGTVQSIHQSSGALFRLRNINRSGAVFYEAPLEAEAGVHFPMFDSEDLLLGIQGTDNFSVGRLNGVQLSGPDGKPYILCAVASDGYPLWHRGFPDGSLVAHVTADGDILVKRPDGLTRLDRTGLVSWIKSFRTTPDDIFFSASNESGSAALDVPSLSENSVRVAKSEPDGRIAWARSLQPVSDGGFPVCSVDTGDRGVVVSLWHTAELAVDHLRLRPYSLFGSVTAFSIIKFSECGSAQWGAILRSYATVLSDRTGGYVIIGRVSANQPIDYNHTEIFPARASSQHYIFHSDAAGVLRAAMLLPLEGLDLRRARLSDSGDILLVLGGNQSPVRIGERSFADFNPASDLAIARIAIDSLPNLSPRPPWRRFGRPGEAISIGLPISSTSRPLAYKWTLNGKPIAPTTPSFDIPAFLESDAGEYRSLVRHAEGLYSLTTDILLWPKLDAALANGDLVLRWDSSDDSVTIQRAETPDGAFQPLTLSPRLNPLLNKMEATIPVDLRDGYFRFLAQ